MAKYRVGPAKALAHSGDYYPDGETQGYTVHDDGTWSEDQPTGVYTPSGDMIWRMAERIGFDLGFED